MVAAGQTSPSPAVESDSTAGASSGEVSSDDELKALMEVKAAIDPRKALTEWQVDTGADGGYCKNWGNTLGCDYSTKKHVTDISLGNEGRYRLHGVLPEGSVLGKLPWLETLWLRNTVLTGTLPSDLGASIKLGVLILESNELQGTYPPQWGRMDSLIIMLLGKNPGLTGTVPQEWCSGLPALEIVSLDLQDGHCVPSACAEKWSIINWKMKSDPEHNSFVCR